MLYREKLLIYNMDLRPCCLQELKKLKKLWVVPVSTILILPVVFFKEMYTIYYIAPVSFIISLFAMYLFPSLSKSLFTRPLYYDDLVDKYGNGKLNKKYQFYFMILNSIYSAALASAILDYAVFKYDQTNLSYFEILGVIGGVLGLYKKWQLIVGKYIMYGLFQCKNLNKLRRTLENAELRRKGIYIKKRDDTITETKVENILPDVGIELSEILPDV